MTETQTKLGNALLKSLIELHESKGKINLEDVGEMFEKMASTLHTDATHDRFLRTEIGKMASYMSQARKEILAISPTEGENLDNQVRGLGDAGAELSAVIEHTEKAANSILDAATMVEEVASELSDKAHSSKLSAAVTDIYQACSFQDITGQRISKVLKTLEYIGAKIDNLAELFCQDADEAESETIDERFTDKRPDAELMSGPQLKAPTQSEIDALFNSMG